MIRRDRADNMFDVVLPDMNANSVKQLMQLLAQQASFLTNKSECDIFQKLLEQEQIASSAVGGGMIISHIRLSNISAPFKIFVRLNRPIECDSLDGQPVDMVSLLISPEEDGALHLRRLSEISRMFREDEFRELIRSADCLDAVKSILMHSENYNASEKRSVAA